MRKGLDRYDNKRNEPLERNDRVFGASRLRSSEYDSERPNLENPRRNYNERVYEQRVSREELENERRDDRGFIERAGDEVRSWFGNEDADRRRHVDSIENERRSRLDNRHESRLQEHYSRTRDQFRAEERAQNVMTNSVVCVIPNDTPQYAARLMRECDCGSLPVVDRDQRLIGILTDRDIVVRLIAPGIDPKRSRVSDCMTSDVFACHEYDSVEDCLREMARHQVRRMPIVNNHNRVIGIISQSDLAIYARENSAAGARRAVADLLYKVSEPSRTVRRR